MVKNRFLVQYGHAYLYERWMDGGIGTQGWTVRYLIGGPFNFSRGDGHSSGYRARQQHDRHIHNTSLQYSVCAPVVYVCNVARKCQFQWRRPQCWRLALAAAKWCSELWKVSGYLTSLPTSFIEILIFQSLSIHTYLGSAVSFLVLVFHLCPHFHVGQHQNLWIHVHPLRSSDVNYPNNLLS